MKEELMETIFKVALTEDPIKPEVLLISSIPFQWLDPWSDLFAEFVKYLPIEYVKKRILPEI